MGETDLISRQAAIDEIEYELEMINSALDSMTLDFNARERLRQRKGEAREILNSIQTLPSAQPEQTDCDYCHEDSDGFVMPIEKNSHAVIYGSVLHIKAKGWNGKVQIKYCPMCGRRLTDG